MARYLTPAKIGLLSLISLYTDGAVPSDAVVPVLSFIASHLMDYNPIRAKSPETTQWLKAEQTVSIVISIKDFEKLLGSYPFLMGMPGRKLWDQFLVKIWDINSLNALHEFFENLQFLMKPTAEELRQQSNDQEAEDDMKLTSNSPLGAFVRRSRLEYQRLRFHDCTELWKEFVKYRQPTAHYLRRKNPNFGRLSFDNVLLLGEQGNWNESGVSALASVAYGSLFAGDHGGAVPVSSDDIESLLDFQIEQMQKYGNRIPVEIRHRFHDLLNDSFLIPSLTYYLSFLDSWRSGDYPTAFDFLHRYFDYTMQYRDRLFYQYALMNLAVLQADFGCHREAVTAMLETVSTARENRDMSCLNFALNWLFHFGRSHPDLVQELQSNSLLGTDKESLAFLRVKAKETGMWTLWSSVILSEAKMCLVNGDSIATSMEQMVRSSQIIVERNMQSMFGSQLLLLTGLWNRLGQTYLSTTTCEIFSRCYRRHSVLEDELKITCKIALIIADKGRYEEALERLDGIDSNSLRSWKPNQYWHKCRVFIKLKRDLYHRNLDGAEERLEQLLQTKRDDIEPDAAFTIDLLHIEYLTRRGKLQDAFAKVEDLLSKLKNDRRDIGLRVKLLILKVSLLSECGRPQRGFSIALRAAGIAWRARLITYLWQAVGAVANILISLGEFAAASQILTAVIPRALENDAEEITAQLYAYLADACMGLAGKAELKSSKRKEGLTKALAAVQRAFDLYSNIEDVNRQCEMMAKKAMIMKLSGDMVLAADYAAAYVELARNAKHLSRGRS